MSWLLEKTLKENANLKAEAEKLRSDLRGLEQAYEIAQSKEDLVRARLKTAETEMAELRDEILRLKHEKDRHSCYPRDAIDM